MRITEYMKEHIVCLDGGMGTLLQARGLQPGDPPERMCLTHPEVVREIHQAYFQAGSSVVLTNTFGANLLKFPKEELQKIISAAVQCARSAAAAVDGNGTEKGERFVALDIGPSGKLLKPYGDYDFEDAVAMFSETVRIGAACGVDLIFLETFSDSYETKAALLAVKESCDLPVFVCNAYGEDGKLMTGASCEAMTALLEGMGADAIGANCSLGPEQLSGVVEGLLSCASVPVILKPNAGLPKSVAGKTVYDVFPQDFAKSMHRYAASGVGIVGGCCGTTPEYIAALHTALCDVQVKMPTDKNRTVVSSYTHAVTFGADPILIGERINPTGKKRLKQALIEKNISYLLNEGLTQQEKGVDILDVNVGIPEINEPEMLKTAVTELQTVTDLPLQIDTSSTSAMEAALRRYNGKAMINSVNGKKENMREIFPLVKKYGGVVVALTLDENGIPNTAGARVEIAKKIIARAAEYGIAKKDIVFDTLTMTVSADAAAPAATLDAMRAVKETLGCHTSLGVSNVSFGLPARDAVNGTFFAMALAGGLSAAIMNPYSVEMMKTYYAYRMLRGMDENCAAYLNFAQTLPAAAPAIGAPVQTAAQNASAAPGKNSAAGTDTDTAAAGKLQEAIVKGMKEEAVRLTGMLLKEKDAMSIVSDDVIPALDLIGKGYEAKTVYLPQLLISAEAAKSAFECIKGYVTEHRTAMASKGDFVLATVQGDIHDIGKNIVRLLLENYGFTVYDLGKDVPPEVIVDEVERVHAPLLGLSALMTTTVPAMEKTIRLARIRTPWCRIVVGGAVLTQEYADAIGADKYARDAMETVRYAESAVAEK